MITREEKIKRIALVLCSRPDVDARTNWTYFKSTAEAVLDEM